MRIPNRVVQTALAGLLALVFVVWPGRWPRPDSVGSGYPARSRPSPHPLGSHKLVAPAFLQAAHAEAAGQSEGGFLLKDAGIAAYAHVSSTLALSTLRPLFRLVERETDTYLIGTLPPPGYERLAALGESMDVHVYIRKDGWIVAYLLVNTPTAKIIDWINYDAQKLSQTTLERTVAQLAERAGQARPVITHYHFQYPGAVALTLIADREDRALSRDNFLIKLPTGLAVFERSWSSGTTYFSICRVQQKELGRLAGLADTWRTQAGILDSQDLPVNKLTEFSIYNESAKYRSYCGLAILHSGVGG